MTISRISSQLVEADTLTPGSHQAGDLFIGFGIRTTSQTAITIPADWKKIVRSTGANSTSRAMAAKWAQSGAEAFGTWTNAQFVALLHYRGSAGLVMPGGVPGTTVNPASLALAFGALSFREDDGTAWVAGIAACSTGDTDMETAPTGLFTRNNLVGSGVTGEVTTYDTDGGVASFGSTTRTMSGTAGNLLRMHCELLELPVTFGGGSVIVIEE